MNIQIFGKSKCFETKKAERYFKERGVKFQSIDLPRYGMSPRELESVVACVGLENLIDPKARDAEVLKYLAYDRDKLEKLPNLVVYRLTADDAQALGGLASRTMALQCTIQEGEALITGEGDPVRVEPVVLFGA